MPSQGVQNGVMTQSDLPLGHREGPIEVLPAHQLGGRHVAGAWGVSSEGHDRHSRGPGSL